MPHAQLLTFRKSLKYEELLISVYSKDKHFTSDGMLTTIAFQNAGKD